MLLRRVTEHIRAQNWTAVVIDFVIVVVGILMAFQITEWAEQRQNNDVKARYLSQLVADLKEDLTEAKRVRGIALLRMAAIDDLFDATRQEEYSEASDTDEWEFGSYEPFDIEKSGPHTGAILDLPRFIAVQDTFSSIVSNGDFKLIDSPLLVRQIQRYYSVAESSGQLEEALWMTFRLVSESRFRNGLSQASGTVFEDLLAAVREDSRMKSELEAYWAYSGYQALWMDNIIERGTALIEAIEAAE